MENNIKDELFNLSKSYLIGEIKNEMVNNKLDFFSKKYKVTRDKIVSQFKSQLIYNSKEMIKSLSVEYDKDRLKSKIKKLIIDIQNR